MDKNNCKFVDLLINSNVNPREKDNYGKTALHYNTCSTCLAIIVKHIIAEESKEGKADLVIMKLDLNCLFGLPIPEMMTSFILIISP